MNNKGFVLGVILILLPFFIALFFLLSFILGTLQIQTDLEAVCQKSQIQTQLLTRKLLLLLLSKNPLAIKLRAHYQSLQIAIAAATAAQNYKLAAKLTQDLNRVINERQILDTLQKQIISEANINLKTGSLTAYSQIVKLLLQKQQQLQILMLLAPAVNVSPAPSLAVEPIYEDIAPPYKTVADFTEHQALIQKWQLHLSTSQLMGRFLPGVYKIQKSCSTSIKGETEQWHLTTLADKF